MKNIKLALIASAFAFSGSAIAASDGVLGTTSTGESDVIIIKQDAVLITDVDNLDFGTVATMTANTAELDDICIFSSTGAYNVTASSSNGGFTLTDGGVINTIGYELRWNGTLLGDGAIQTGETGDAASLSCGGTPNATFEATIAALDFNAAAPGNYQDTVTLVIASE